MGRPSLAGRPHPARTRRGRCYPLRSTDQAGQPRQPESAQPRDGGPQQIMAKRARGTTTRPGQRRPMQRPAARPVAAPAPARGSRRARRRSPTKRRREPPSSRPRSSRRSRRRPTTARRARPQRPLRRRPGAIVLEPGRRGRQRVRLCRPRRPPDRHRRRDAGGRPHGPVGRRPGDAHHALTGSAGRRSRPTGATIASCHPRAG